MYISSNRKGLRLASILPLLLLLVHVERKNILCGASSSFIAVTALSVKGRVRIPTRNTIHSISNNNKNKGNDNIKMNTNTMLRMVSTKVSKYSTAGIKIKPKLVTISESKWRSDAHCHYQRIRSLLKPGLTSIDDQINSGIKRQTRKKNRNGQLESALALTSTPTSKIQQMYQEQQEIWTALNGKNPIYNFLIEYYGLKGAKGPRRLGRWSPDPTLLLLDSNDAKSMEADGISIKSLDTDHYDTDSDEAGNNAQAVGVNENDDEELFSSIMTLSKGQGGIFLENANEDDLTGVLNLRGAIPIVSPSPSLLDSDSDSGKIHGILYNPALFYNKYSPIKTDEERKKVLKTIAPFQWYESILRTTINSEPVLHCHGLHEWAMLYHPPGAPTPPSTKYQSDLPIRVSRETINEAVERRGISCTHVDALRFFAPAAGPLNYHGSSLQRTQQLQLEQKGCVHAHMDLLKIALKIQPFIDSDLLSDVLEISIAARKLDVEASPYDVTGYGGGVVPVETKEGRKLYRSRQKDLMERAEPVRERLLEAYNAFMILSFNDEFILKAKVKIDKEQTDGTGTGTGEISDNQYAAPERFARAEPGGLPWRKNLIET